MRFFLIDRITDWQPGVSAEAVKNVALSEDFFDDHFPRRPVMPGVLMLEGMAQLSGLLLEASLAAWAPAGQGEDSAGDGRRPRDAKAVLTVLERTKFRDLVRPGDTLVYRARLISVNRDGGKVSVEAVRAGPGSRAGGTAFQAVNSQEQDAPATGDQADERVVVTTAMVFAFKYVDDPQLEARRATLMSTWMPTSQGPNAADRPSTARCAPASRTSTPSAGSPTTRPCG